MWIELIILAVIFAAVGYAACWVAGKESRWEEMRELDLTDAEPQDDEEE